VQKKGNEMIKTRSNTSRKREGVSGWEGIKQIRPNPIKEEDNAVHVQD